MHKFPGTPPRLSLHGRDYRFRLIDFEVARKTNKAPAQLFRAQAEDALRICMALNDGYDSGESDADSDEASDEDVELQFPDFENPLVTRVSESKVSESVHLSDSDGSESSIL